MFGAFKRASFLKLEVIMNQTMWEKNVKQKIWMAGYCLEQLYAVCPTKCSFIRKKNVPGKPVLPTG